MWPCIWIWLRTFYDHSKLPRSLHIGEEDAAIYLRGYNLVTKLLFLIAFPTSPTPLSIVTKKTEGVMVMMVIVWIEEGRDVSATCGFKASTLLSSTPLDLCPIVLPHILARCGGSQDAVVKILLCCIKNNAKQADPDWQSLRYDTLLMMDQLYPLNRPGVTILREAMSLHPRFMTAMVDLLSLLLRAKTSCKFSARPTVSHPQMPSDHRLSVCSSTSRNHHHHYHCTVFLHLRVG